MQRRRRMSGGRRGSGAAGPPPPARGTTTAPVGSRGTAVAAVLLLAGCGPGGSAPAANAGGRNAAPTARATTPADGRGASLDLGDPAALGLDELLAESPSPLVSLSGETIAIPPLPAARRAEQVAHLRSAAAAWQANPGDEEAIVWLGRRLAYLGYIRQAVEVYGRGLELHPGSYRLLRHRGHRWITLRRLDRAVEDLEAAARALDGRAPEVEADGIPNRLGVPLTTGHFNVWYHLGLAHYLRGDFEAARRAYERCMVYSDNPDTRVASTDWLYMTYRQLGLDEEAAAILEPVDASLEVVENGSYHRRLLMYRGELSPDELLAVDDPDDPDAALTLATQGYGVGNWYLVEGDPDRARQIFERVVAGSSPTAFGTIAAEAELARGFAGPPGPR